MLSQLESENISREILKAYSGFKHAGVKTIVTGNWGCGAFNGDLELKFMIQWLAVSLAGKKMRYVPFGYRKVLDSPVVAQMQPMRIQEAYTVFMTACAHVRNDVQTRLFEAIKKHL